MKPLPHQISGAKFLADRQFAMLADSPRVGKTGAAIIACDDVMASVILAITTASGRSVWRAGFKTWSNFDRPVHIATRDGAIPAVGHDGLVVIVGWPDLSHPKLLSQLLRIRWNRILSDEDHLAKNFDAKRTQSLYGTLVRDGAELMTGLALCSKADGVWPLTGTPLPHSPFDTYPRLRALAPERLLADEARGWPDVTVRGDFLHRYCQVRMKKISAWNKIPVIVDGRNLEELNARLDGFYLRRTQEDVGIRPPVAELLPLIVSERARRSADGDASLTAVLEAAASGSTRELDMHLGPLRRITGEIKAWAALDAVKDEFECGLDKIVLMYWHKNVGDILKDGLAKFGVVGIDGGSTPTQREAALAAFARPDGPRVFAGQIVAAGEAVDLSAAAVLWFVESSFTPKDMAQASLRITNHGQLRQAVVKVCTLEGSIDEALQARLLMLWNNIREVLKGPTQ
jgi:hypothetical protein